MEIEEGVIEKIDVTVPFISMATPNGDFLDVMLQETPKRFAVIDIRDSREVVDKRVLSLIKSENAVRKNRLLRGIK